jgi:hypothetical protein
LRHDLHGLNLGQAAMPLKPVELCQIAPRRLASLRSDWEIVALTVSPFCVSLYRVIAAEVRAFLLL